MSQEIRLMLKPDTQLAHIIILIKKITQHLDHQNKIAQIFSHENRSEFFKKNVSLL